MIHLTKNYYGVVVPKDARDIGIGVNAICPITTLYFADPKATRFPYTYINIDGKFELIGTITKDECNFDTTPFATTELYTVESAADELRLLINSKGKFFENSEKPTLTSADYDFGNELDFEYEKQWQQIQDNLIDKMVIIKKNENN